MRTALFRDLAAPLALLCSLAAAPGRAAVALPREPDLILGRDAGGWLRHLEAYENSTERNLALYCLSGFKERAAPAVPLLARLFRDPLYADQSLLMLEALGAIGPPARPAVPALLAALRSEDEPAVRRKAACAALARIAPEDADVGSAILAALSGDEPEVLRRTAVDCALTVALHSRKRDKEAAAALGRLARQDSLAAEAAVALRFLEQRGLELLAAALAEGRTPSARLAAARALRASGPAALPVLAALVRAAKKDEDLEVRAAALNALRRVAPQAPESLAAFLEGLGEEGLTEVAEEALAGAPAEALAVATQAFSSRRAPTRAAAARVLRRLGPVAAPALKDLLKALEDRDSEVRLAAAAALDALGPPAAAAAPALGKLALEARDFTSARLYALAAANVKRPPEKPRWQSPFQPLSEAQLLQILSAEPTNEGRAEAAMVLRERTSAAEQVVPALLAALLDRGREVRLAAAKSLAFFGPRAAPALPVLLGWLDRGDPGEQAAACAALAGLGLESPEVCARLVALVQTPAPDRDSELRKYLHQALRAQGTAPAAGLAEALKNPAPESALRAAQALEALGPQALESLPALVEALEHDDPRVARAAFKTLAAFGDSARLALSQLIFYLDDPREERRAGAAWAIAWIGFPENFEPLERVHCLDTLFHLVLDPCEEVAQAAHSALVNFKADSLPRLRELLALGGETPLWGLRVLARMQADPEAVLPRLAVFTFPGMHPLERSMAAELLGEYAPDFPECLPLLVRLLGDREALVVDSAGAALKRYGPAAGPFLQDALRSRDPRLRLRALDLLDRLGRAGR